MPTEKDLLNAIAFKTAQNFALTVAAGELLTQAVLRTESDKEEALASMLSAVTVAVAKVEMRSVGSDAQTYLRTGMDGMMKPVELYARDRLGLGRLPETKLS